VISSIFSSRQGKTTPEILELRVLPNLLEGFLKNIPEPDLLGEEFGSVEDSPKRGEAPGPQVHAGRDVSVHGDATDCGAGFRTDSASRGVREGRFKEISNPGPSFPRRFKRPSPLPYPPGEDPLLFLPVVADQGHMDEDDFFDSQILGQAINTGKFGDVVLQRR